MNRLFLFNPENDIALGMGLPRITPPRQAALLHRAGAMIPYWLGEKGDAVVVCRSDYQAAREWAAGLEMRRGLTGPYAVYDVKGDADLIPEPWGWSLDAVAQLRDAGLPQVAMERFLGRMERRRDLSHRRTAREFLSRWSEVCAPLRFPLPVEARDGETVERLVGEWGSAIVKSPWSSSGRGVFPVTRVTLRASLPRVGGIIEKQGGVMVEPLLPKLQDFAMLFDYRDGVAVFAGYSLFFNSTATNYGGNYVGPNELIATRLSRWIPSDELRRVRVATERILPSVLGDDYEGPLGVDMMVCGDDADAWIDPCVEINLRYTMGFVARGVWRKLGIEGVMAIVPKNGKVMGLNENGKEPWRLLPENDWFEFLFRPS